MSAEFKLFCNISRAESLAVDTNTDGDSVAFVYTDKREDVIKSVHVSRLEARAFAHFLLAITE